MSRTVSILIALVIIVIDQISKWLAHEYLLGQPPLAVLPFLNFAVVFNTGAAFGFLNQASGWQNLFFIGIALAVSVYIFISLGGEGQHNKQLALSLALILAGALGNLIDRIRLGYVVDFIDVYYQQWHFWTFNIADSAITIGAILLLLDALGLSLFRTATVRE